MKFFFPNNDTDSVIGDLKKSLSGRKLGEMVAIDKDGKDVVVKISKLGTSTITFSPKQATGGQEWSLKSEKIALSHRAFKDDVLAKLNSIVEGIGGKTL
jgi:hypothetical protein